MDAVEEIKSRLAIEDVVGQYIQLKRAGRNFKGLSPFSNERTPSFMVSPEKQIWHDFSSGKGGNMFSFVMEMEGLDFKGALELLARKAGVDLDQHRGPSAARTKEKERLYEALELATKFYQAHLGRKTDALDYVLKKRQFTKQTALEWRLGYSPESGQAVVEFLRGKKFTDHEIKAAGLSAQRYRGVGDMFRGRIMVPLMDAQGRVIGFTARLLKDNPNAPKYINTPQTLLYDKSRHVFGLHLAKEAIRRAKYAVIAEGNLDVVSSHQAGVRQVVATAGTALTEQQLKMLARFGPDIRLSFDADQAGVRAAERAIPIASKVGVSLSIIAIPSGKDPDELIKQDPGLWQATIEKPQYAIDWLIDRYTHELDITSAQGKKAFSDVLLSVVGQLADEVEKEHYINHLASLLGVTKEALLSKLRPEKMAPQKRLKAATEFTKEDAEYLKTQNRLLALALWQPDLYDIVAPLTPEMLMSDEARAVLEFMRRRQETGKDKSLLASLRPLGEYVKILLLLYEELYKSVEPHELQLEGERLRSRLIERYIKIQKPLLDKAIEQALQLGETDSPQFKKLHQTITNLNTLRKKYATGG